MLCDHVYRSMGSDICPQCGKRTNEVNWQLQNKMAEEWKIANPNAKSDGWWSI
jgi:hypothetical protein